MFRLLTSRPRYGRGLSFFGDDYGWPWTYRTESFKTADIRIDAFDQFYWLGLVGDIAVGVAIVVAAVIILEWVYRIISRRTGR